MLTAIGVFQLPTSPRPLTVRGEGRWQLPILPESTFWLPILPESDSGDGAGAGMRSLSLDW